MEEYIIEGIEVPDEIIADYEMSKLSSEDLIKVVKHFGYNDEQAASLVNNNVATVINCLTSFRLYEAFKSGSLDMLPKALRFVKMDVFYVDDCQLISLSLPETPAIDEENINWIRVQLSSYYPEKLRSHTMTITTPNGKQIKLSTYNLLQAHQFDQIFEYYSRWYKQQSKWVGPKFDQIDKCLGEWLRGEVTKGIWPQQDEFISWFVSNRLGTLSLAFELTFDKESGYIVPGSKVPVRLNIQNLAEHFTPEVMEQDFIEFGFWKYEQIENLKQHVLAKRALAHQNSKKDPSIALQSSYLQLFNTETDAHACLELMQKMNLIDASGRNKIGQREKYRLMALVEVLQQKSLLPPALPTSGLATTIAEQIQMPYQRARSGDRKNYDSAMRDYLNKLNAVSIGSLTWSMLVDNGR